MLLSITFDSYLICSGITKIEPGEEVDVFDRPVPLVKAYWVEVPVRLLNYGSLAWSVIYLTPLLWKQCGLV